MGLTKLVAMSDLARGPIIPLTGNRSLDFADSATEQLAHTDIGTFSCTHMRNKFTVAVWFKRGTSATTKTAYSFALNTSEHGRVRIITTSSLLSFSIGSPTATTNEKLYRISATDVNWQHIVAVINKGSSEELVLYKNGVDSVPTKTTDNALSDRSSTSVTWINEVGQSLLGPLYSLAVWDKALNADEVRTIYNNGNAPGVNLLVNQGKYKSGKKCRHWWVPEGNAGNLGKDYGRSAVEGINLMRNALNISADDLIVDAPIG